jgi:hypothetical protein
MSEVVFDAEVVSHFIHADMPAHEVDAMLRPLRITVVPVDKALTHLVGRLPGVAAGAGLSLGDPPLPRTGTARRDTRLDQRSELEDDRRRRRGQGGDDSTRTSGSSNSA